MQLRELRRGPRSNRYCGPAVISYLTGLDTTDAARLVRKLNPDITAVKGLHIRPLINTLQTLGFNCRWMNTQKPTFKQWLRDSKEDRTAGRVWLVATTGHYQLVTGRKFACGITGELVSLSDKRIQNRARVVAVFELTENATRKAMHADACKAATRPSTNSSNRKVRSLAAKHAIDVDFDRFSGGGISIYFDLPDDIAEYYARQGGDVDTVAYSWDEAVGVLDDLVELVKTYQEKVLDTSGAVG